MNWTEEEMYHALEKEHEQAQSCAYEEKTGDKRYPVLCLRDSRYSTTDYCAKCRKRREHRV